MTCAANWTRAADLRQQLEKLWLRGALLAATLDEQALFPLRLSCKSPSSTEISENFSAVRTWLADLKALPHYRLEMRELRHRLFGSSQLPHAVWVDSLDKALLILGKTREAAQFAQIVSHTRQQHAALLPWLAKRSLRALDYHANWHKLLAVITWMQQHPQPGIYLRQVDLPGIDSKFIEAHRVILSELLELCLPASALAKRDDCGQDFAARYGFLDKPQRIRLRPLDTRLAILPALPVQDVTLDAASLAAIALPIKRVFITENEINYLAFPAMPDSLLLFGSGYGFSALKEVRWLQDCEIFYWGDIDTHGFAILAQLRSLLPQVQSLMMDQATLLAHEAQWVTEEKPTQQSLPNLTTAENQVYLALHSHWRKVRLEQERIGFSWVEKILGDLEKP